MSKQTILGIDMGGTHIRAGYVSGGNLASINSQKVNAQASMEEVLQELFGFIDPLINDTVTAIGMGVPGLVVAGTVYDVVNIPSWNVVPLQQMMEDHYKLPVLINNDANCFALGEFYFGKGNGYDSMIGLTIGTGLGSGIIIHKKLYAGKNGGAGEFGMAEYLDKNYEYYASGQFFQNVYEMDGESVFKKAKEGDIEALEMYEELGAHLGNAIKMILYALDIELIIIGGSVRHSFSYFSGSMWRQIKTFAYRKALDNFNVEVSGLENSGILGAAALHYDFKEGKNTL